jgi:hypothetical protein
MLDVVGIVDDIVEEVGRGGKEAVDEKRDESLEKQRQVEEFSGKNDSRENDEILHPLARAQGLEINKCS